MVNEKQLAGIIEMFDFLHDAIADTYDNLEESNEFTKMYDAIMKKIKE